MLVCHNCTHSNRDKTDTPASPFKAFQLLILMSVAYGENSY